MNSKNTDSKNHVKPIIFSILDTFRKKVIWFLLLLIMVLAIFVYYWYEWGTLIRFVEAMDHDSQFMQDFALYYYPIGRQILQNPFPASGYLYSSFFALVLAPIGALPLNLAMVVWGGVQIACLVCFCFFSANWMLNYKMPGLILFGGLCATSYPILNNLKWGQVSVLITLCVITAFLLNNNNKRILGGIVLAFAAAIKFYPAIFIIYFIFKRNVRFCLAFGLALSVFYVLFPVSVLGFSNWFQFEKTTFDGLIDASWISQDSNSQYFVHVGLRWFAIIFDRTGGFVVEKLLTYIGYLLALTSMILAWLLHRKIACEKYGLAMTAIFISTPFLVKTSWPHYFVYLPLCQAALFSYYASSFSISTLWRKSLILLPIFSAILSSIFFFNLFPGWRIFNSYGMIFFANSLLMASLFAIAIMEYSTSFRKIYLTTPMIKVFQRVNGK